METLPAPAPEKLTPAERAARELDALRQEVASGTPAYLYGQRDFLLRLGKALPTLGDRLINFITAPVHHTLSPKGDIIKSVDEGFDLTPEQASLLKTLLNKAMPAVDRLMNPGPGVGAAAPGLGQQGAKVSITINTIGPDLDPALAQKGIVGGQAIPTSTVRFARPGQVIDIEATEAPTVDPTPHEAPVQTRKGTVPLTPEVPEGTPT